MPAAPTIASPATPTRIRHQRQQRRRNRPSQHQPVVHTRHATKDQLPQPARPNRRRNRSHPDASHRSRPQSSQNHTASQRKLHLK